MIQRKQTLFLLFAIILMAGYLYSPIIAFDANVGYTYLKGYELTKNIGFPFIGHYFVFFNAILAGIAIGISLIAIFLYKKRQLQQWFCWLAIVPTLGCFFYAYYRWAVMDTTFDQIFYYGNITPWVVAICLFLAGYFVKKDEDLVRSVDRLR